MSETRQVFKELAHQKEAAEAVVACFEGQPCDPGPSYTIDPGASADPQASMFDAGTRNADVALSDDALLDNIRRVQTTALLPPSNELSRTPAARINLDIEMETGTGKTYVYIDTMYRLHRDYGWSKFIVVVPSVAIREGVYKTFEDTEAHFQGRYGHKVRRFIYDSLRLEQLTSYSEDRGLQCMIINSQAFVGDFKEAQSNKASRIIFGTPDRFGSRRPIDVIAANRPILIIDEPQRVEGKGAKNKTREALAFFNAPIALRYSATHARKHDLVHRLDALDAYEAKLVKRISVRGVTMKGAGGTTGYLVLDRIETRGSKAPRARVHMEVKRKGAVEPRPDYLWVEKGDNLYDKSKGVDAYRDYVVSDMHAGEGTLSFTAREPIRQGEIVGTQDTDALRRVQIRETIDAHLERERHLFAKGIKVLSLFFIDEVAKYRHYDENGEATAGDYARMFEEEYALAVEEQAELDATDAPWLAYIKRDAAKAVHEGYFSIDKRGRLEDPDVHKRGEEEGEAKDVSAYDLILKRKGELLSFDQPVRFIFSHSALREGWDNPNVFQICTLKHSNSDVAKRQEIGRGLRIAVDRNGQRTDGSDVHGINVLTVVASESYEAFAKGLQDEMREALQGRPTKADGEYFKGKVVRHEGGDVEVTESMAGGLEDWLVKNDFVDRARHILPAYHEAKTTDALPPMPADLEPYREALLRLVDTVFDPSQLSKLTGNDRDKVTPKLRRENFDKKAFRELWRRINQKAVYFSDFDTDGLVRNAVPHLNEYLTVPKPVVIIERGRQRANIAIEDVRGGRGMMEDRVEREDREARVRSAVRFDLVGRLAADTSLTRGTIGRILKGMKADKFALFARNPEAFIKRTGELIQVQKIALAIETIHYNRTNETYDVGIFTDDQTPVDRSRTIGPTETGKSVFDHVVFDSNVEATFARRMEGAERIVVYAKLPSGFSIPTPGGNYNPDWAIVLTDNAAGTKEIYFVAETKGSMRSDDLREVERQRIECAKAFFDLSTNDVQYDVIDSYDALIEAIT